MTLWTPQALDLSLYMGTDAYWEIIWLDGATAVDFSADVSEARMQIRENFTDAAPLIDIDNAALPATGSWIDISEANLGKVGLWVSHTDTAAITFDDPASIPRSMRVANICVELEIPTGTVLSVDVAAALGITGTTATALIIQLARGTVKIYPSTIG